MSIIVVERLQIEQLLGLHRNKDRNVEVDAKHAELAEFAEVDQSHIIGCLIDCGGRVCGLQAGQSDADRLLSTA